MTCDDCKYLDFCIFAEIGECDGYCENFEPRD